MGVGQLPAGQIRRSIQRFNDYAEDLVSADDNTFEDRLSMFVEFCRTDPTISRIHQQLLGVPHVDLEGWLETAFSTREAIFPTDPERRLSLMYQLLLAIQSKSVNFLNLVLVVFPVTGNVEAHTRAFCSAVIAPLVRDLRYRIDEIQLPDDNSQVVGASVLQIIHNTGTLVQQVAPHAIQPSMATTAILDHAQLRTHVEALREAVSRLDLPASIKQEAVDVVNAIAEESASLTPRISVLKSLLKGLPPAADIAQIVGTIGQIIGLFVGG
jgi:hypothetical protein